MSHERLLMILADIQYRDWTFHVQNKGDGFLLQVSFMAPDSSNGKVAVQKSRKWYISSHSCRNEVIRTVYKAIVAAEEHERDENFKYKDVAVFDPHRSLDDVAILDSLNIFNIDVRVPNKIAG